VDVLADSNVILRRLHRAHPQHRDARHAIAHLSREGHRICIATQNLIEVWAVTTRPIDSNGLGLAPAQAERVLLRVEQSAFRLPETDDVYAEWRRLVVFHGVSGKKAHDARLVAVMNVHRISHILTFNVDDFERYSKLTVLHPSKLS
jgi:predicted nucleic acid-binding protein